jgi:pseudaminic acid synthase
MKFKIPFFIAEISANHCGDIKLAKKLIKCAKENGADAVKLQTFTANTMTLKSSKKYFKIKKGLWKGYQLWDLYNKAHTPFEWHKELFNYSRSIGLEIFSTPFDETAVDLLESLNCKFYKISSFEMNDLPLIRRIAKTRKPVIISTGTSNLAEISETYNFAKKNKINDLTLLYCVSNYPSRPEDFNLNNIKILKKKFKCRIGLSDHSTDNNIAMAAIAAGAEIIEKHIGLENQKKGLDIKFSLKGKEIKKFRRDIDFVFNLMGKNEFFRNKNEDESKKFRRSIFAVRDIKKGEIFSKQNIKRIRPGNGLPPKYYDMLINKKSKFSIKKGEPITKKFVI